MLYGLVPLLGIFSAAGVGSQLRAGMTMRTLAERFRDFGGINIVFTVVGMVATVVYIKLVKRSLGATHAGHTRGLMLYLVRHAKAGSSHDFTGDDRLRPLSPAGRRQAKALADRCSSQLG